MKTLYLDCGMGIAGDMLMGALYECLSDKSLFWAKWKDLNLEGIELIAEETKKCGITCTHMKVLVKGVEEESLDVLEHTHHHEHAHEHTHEHTHEHSHEHSHEHVHEHTHEHEHEHTHEHEHEHTHEHAHEHVNEHAHNQEAICHDECANAALALSKRNGETANIRNTVNFDCDSQNAQGQHSQHLAHHHHSHTSMQDVVTLVEQLNLSEKLKKQVLSVYEKIATAESKVHGVSVEQIHFHEVGNLDALADIVGCILLLDMLAVDQVLASPINVGFGKVRCAHGILPVPAPATAEILKNTPIYSGRFEGEMCTPTGAALYQTIVGKTIQMPIMTMETVGYGCGKKDFEAANVVRAVIGEAVEDLNPNGNTQLPYEGTTAPTDSICELICNLDDMTGEDISLAQEILLQKGALDVFTTPIYMKKNRLGTMLTVLCKEEDKQLMGELIFRHTTTIGIRQRICERMILKREIKQLETPYGSMQYKEVSGYGTQRSKIEFEDLKAAVSQFEKSIREIRAEIDKLL